MTPTCKVVKDFPFPSKSNTFCPPAFKFKEMESCKTCQLYFEGFGDKGNKGGLLLDKEDPRRKNGHWWRIAILCALSHITTTRTRTVEDSVLIFYMCTLR